jgi:[glutamine synthetase] adenylyltransferase / [glutamine synthetase]-adenylyl-L-tyrosine phosphorylase
MTRARGCCQCDALPSKQQTIVRVTSPARLLEDPPGEAALARLRRCGFAEPERAARELRLVASHPRLGPALQKGMGSLLGSLSRLPDALGALVRLERFAREDEALTLRKLLERGSRSREALLWALGGSPFLAEQVIRHPEWAEWLTRPRVLASAPGARAIAAEARRLVAGRAPAAARDALRLLRRREVLRIAIRELLRLTSVSGTLASLSALADGLVEAALEVAASELGEPPARSAAAPSTPGFAVLALGKLGGAELNFSSDVDLVYVHRDAGPEAGSDARAQALGRQLTAVLADTTEEGHVYRVDLRLRPEGRAGSISHSLQSAAEYYRWRGATWERLALLKARPLAGDRAVARELLRQAGPFVWSQPFGPDAVAEVLRHKHESDRRLAARQLENRHVKLGRGGIREIELVAQVLQIRAGGRRRKPRARGTLVALEELRSAGALSAAAHGRLARAYVFLRDVENKLQMVADTQTHTLPAENEALRACALRLGYADGPAPAEELLRRDYRRHTTAAHRVFVRVFEETAA